MHSNSRQLDLQTSLSTFTRQVTEDYKSNASDGDHPAVGTSKTVRRLSRDFKPSNHCVLCGRGKECLNAVGNRRFRVTVNTFLERYSQTTTKSGKSQIVTEIMQMIRSAGGKFVKYDDDGWYEISEAAAREKVGAHFRDCLHTAYRSSGKAKTAARRARKQMREHAVSAPSGSCEDSRTNMHTVKPLPTPVLDDDFSWFENE